MYLNLKQILLLFCFSSQTSAAYKSRQEILAQLLKDYDTEVYPNDVEGNQTDVTVQLNIVDVDLVNVQAEEIEMIVNLRMAWHDPRLQFKNETNIKFSFIELTGNNVDKVWMPDLYFYNERKAKSHETIAQEKLLQIYPNGDIAFSKRITLAIECIMTFEMFPFDEQKCTLHLESYAYTTRSLVLTWTPDEPVTNVDHNTPYFDIKEISTTYGTRTWSSSIYSTK